jgi:hypothetical protein
MLYYTSIYMIIEPLSRALSLERALLPVVKRFPFLVNERRSQNKETTDRPTQLCVLCCSNHKKKTRRVKQVNLPPHTLRQQQQLSSVVVVRWCCWLSRWFSNLSAPRLSLYIQHFKIFTILFCIFLSFSFVPSTPILLCCYYVTFSRMVGGISARDEILRQKKKKKK